MWHLIHMGLSQLVSEKRNKNLTPKARLIAEISKTRKSGDLQKAKKERTFVFYTFHKCHLEVVTPLTVRFSSNPPNNPVRLK